MARVSHVEVTPGSTWWPARSHERVSLFYCLICFGDSHPPRSLAILAEGARRSQLIARQGSPGHRMVRLHTLNSLSPALTFDAPYRSSFLFASRGMVTSTLSSGDGTEVSVFDDRWLIRYGTTGRVATLRMCSASLGARCNTLKT
jgi:hypothetical protein